MSTPRPTFFVHIGTRKSGTSFLQLSLRRLTDDLLAQGLARPFVDWPDHRRSLGDPVLACVGDTEEAVKARATLHASASRCIDAGTPRVLASFEKLAELDTERIAVFAECFADLDLHIVITARHWGSVLPSEWQQGVKERCITTTFPDFLDEVRSGEGLDATLFRSRQDIADIATRWGSVVGDDRVTILPLPASVAEPELLPRRFFGLMGVDPTEFTYPPRNVNKSLSYASSETLRRINHAMGDRLPPFTQLLPQFPYRSFLQRTLARHDGPTAKVPAEHREWVEDEARRQVAQLRGGPWNVVGELEDLIPGSWPDEVPIPTEAEIAAITVDIAADLTVRMTNAAELPEELRVAAPLPQPGLAARIRGRLRRS